MVNPRRALAEASHVPEPDKLAQALAADRPVVQAEVLPYLPQRNTAPAVVAVNECDSKQRRRHRRHQALA